MTEVFFTSLSPNSAEIFFLFSEIGFGRLVASNMCVTFTLINLLFILNFESF